MTHRMHFQTFLASMLLAGMLSACSPASPPTPETTDNASDSTASVDTTCNAENAMWAVGKPVDETLLAKAKADATAGIVRTLSPDQVVTMEYNGTRLNLRTDDKGIVLDVACG